jgi:integrase
VRTYADSHGSAPLVDRVQDPDDRVREIERALAVFDELDERLGSGATKRKYLGAVQDWYRFLDRRGRAAFNPVENLQEEYDWRRRTSTRTELSTDGVRRLATTARDRNDDLAASLLVLATCAWGLRRREVAELHVRQLELDGDDPHITFDGDRKSGPGTVALMVGTDVLERRWRALAGRDAWDGYLFPSPQANRSHVTPDTVTDRFKRLAPAADLGEDRDPPRPHRGRAWWYDRYTEAVGEVAERLEFVADEQGSTDETVVLENYLTEERRRRERRRAMRGKLESAFDHR